MSWNELADLLEIKRGKLNAYIYETSLISEEIYKKIDSKKQFSKAIVESLPEQWGKIKGGKLSKGKTKEIFFPNYSEDFAEFYGIMLGDGNLNKIKSYKKGTYMIRIVGDSRYDKDYLFRYISSLLKKLFAVKAHFGKFKNQNAIYVGVHSSKLINFLESEGFKPGNKIRNKLTIPEWIFEKESFLKACLRGLIDTDGSIFRMSKRDPNLIRINFTNHNLVLLNDTRKAFLQLGYHPSKIICEKQFYLSRQSDIRKYLKDIGFSNKKHLDRVKMFYSSIV